MKIGLFDSGVGGICVLHEAMRRLRTPEYLYMADRDYAPYGLRSTAEIRERAAEITRLLTAEGAEAVVIACNTATSAAVTHLRELVPVPVIGMEPAVKPALSSVEKKEGKRVLVLATPLTIGEDKLRDLLLRLDAHHLVDLKPLPELVDYAEKGIFEGSGVTQSLRSAFADTDTSAYGAVVTGCTHFFYFLPVLRTFFPAETVFFDGGQGTVRQLAKVCALPYEDSYLPAEAAADVKRVTYYDSAGRITDHDTVESFRALHARLGGIVEDRLQRGEG